MSRVKEEIHMKEHIKKQLEVPIFCFMQRIDRRILYGIIHS